MGLVRGGPSTQKFDDVVKVQAGFAFGDGEQGELRVAGAEGDAVCTLLVCNSLAQLPLNIHAYIRKRELCNTRAYVCA